MSTINSITTTVISAFQGVTPVTTTTSAEAPANTAPAFQETLTTTGRAFALGLGAPRNHGDIEALFAEIATKFGAEVAKANDYANAAQTAVRSTALTAAAGFMAFFASFNQVMVSSQLNIKEQTQVIGEKTTVINKLEAEKAPLVQQRDALVNEYWNNVNTYWQNVNTINGLNAQLGSLIPQQQTACAANGSSAACQSLTSQVNGINAQIGSLQTQNVNLTNRNNQIGPQIDSLNAQISVLQGKIDVATSERNTASNSRNQSQNAYNTALATINVLSAVIIPFTVSLALGQVGAGARASFDSREAKDGVDNAVAQAVNRLAELSEEMGTLSQLRQALFQMQPTMPEPTMPEPTMPSTVDNTDSGGLSGLGQPPVADLAPPSEDPRPDIIPGTQPLPPTPVVQPPVADGAMGPQDAVVDPSQRPSGMEILRQILANLPVRTDDLLPDPPTTTDASPVQGGQPEQPQTAFEIVRQLLQDMLPPAVGNAEEVAQRVGDLATALTLLRGALAQMADAEGAQTTQVPGASGRLTLAI